MKKFITAVMAFLLLQSMLPSFSQGGREISGKVLDTDNKPLANISVLLQGSKTGTQTNSSGSFTINANTGNTLVFSAVGYEAQRVKVGSSNSVLIQLKEGASVLNEVTVAMDQKRNPRELGYSAQSVGGGVIAETQRENFVNSLQGRVAGLTVTPTTGVAGASSGIVLRGYNSLSGTNQPLFVVDGIVIDNQTLNWLPDNYSFCWRKVVAMPIQTGGNR